MHVFGAVQLPWAHGVVQIAKHNTPLFILFFHRSLSHLGCTHSHSSPTHTCRSLAPCSFHSRTLHCTLARCSSIPCTSTCTNKHCSIHSFHHSYISVDTHHLNGRRTIGDDGEDERRVLFDDVVVKAIAIAVAMAPTRPTAPQMRRTVVM